MKYKSHYLQAIIGVILLYQKLRRLPRHLTGYLMLSNKYSKKAKNNCAFTSNSYLSMSHYSIITSIFQRQNMNNEKIPEQHRTLVLFRDFSIFLQLNRYKFHFILANLLILCYNDLIKTKGDIKTNKSPPF